MANQVPDYSAEVRKLHATGLFDLREHHGQGAFTDACVSMLHGKDEAWGHLIKKPGQTSVHDHGEDSALYLFDDGTAKAVDFIGGAGGPNPQPGWIVDNTTPYKEVDWFSPTDHGIYESAEPVPPFIPSYEDLGGDSWHRAEIGVPLQADMAAAGQPLNDGSAVWFSRTIYDCIVACIQAGSVIDRAPIVRKHRNEWRAILGLPPV